MSVDLRLLQIYVRKDRYEARHGAVCDGLIDLWEGSASQKPKDWDNHDHEWKANWVDNGWGHIYRLDEEWVKPVYDDDPDSPDFGKEILPVPPPTEDETWKTYSVTMLQTGERATKERISFWKKIAGNPNTFKIYIDGVLQ